MFTILSLRKTEDLTAEELAYLRRMLAEYAVTGSGLWLQTLPWTRFAFRWCPAMRDSDGVMGCFTPLYPDTVYLLPPDEEIPKMNGGRSFWIEELFTTIIHELRHALQWKLSKIAYIICALPGLRTFTLERDANEAGNAARTFTERWIAKHDYIAASKRGMAESVLPEDENAG